MIIDIMQSQTIVAASASFAAGWCLGWFMRGLYYAGKNTFRIRMEQIIQITIFLLWTMATFRAVIYDTVEYPPLFLNLMFGAIAGSMNRSVGNYLIEGISAFISYSKKK